MMAVAPDDDEIRLLLRRIVNLEAENIMLRKKLQDLEQLRTDISLQTFFDAIGLAAAVGEASMPDRAIGSIQMTLKSYLASADGGVALRFQPPELGALAHGLSTTCFEMAKVPPASDAPAPPKLYSVLLEKQLAFTNLTTRIPEAAAVAGETATALANTGGWTFAYLVQEAASIASLEQGLVAAITAIAVPGTAADFQAGVRALSALTDQLKAKPRPVAGDVLALSDALNTTTIALRRAIP
jgi:hypothetical protein